MFPRLTLLPSRLAQLLAPSPVTSAPPAAPAAAIAVHARIVPLARVAKVDTVVASRRRKELLVPALVALACSRAAAVVTPPARAHPDPLPASKIGW